MKTLTSWTRVIQKSILTQLVKSSFSFCGPQKFIAVFAKARHWWDPEPGHIFTPYLFTFHPSIVLPSTNVEISGRARVNALDLYLGRTRFESWQRLIMTEVFRVFPRFLQLNPRLNHDRFLPNLFQLIALLHTVWLHTTSLNYPQNYSSLSQVVCLFRDFRFQFWMRFMFPMCDTCVAHMILFDLITLIILNMCILEYCIGSVIVYIL